MFENVFFRFYAIKKKYSKKNRPIIIDSPNSLKKIVVITPIESGPLVDRFRLTNSKYLEIATTTNTKTLGAIDCNANRINDMIFNK